jgi:hypothetical protein
MQQTLVGTLSAGKNAIEVCPGVAQPGSALALGASCRRFESVHPDHKLSARARAERWPSLRTKWTQVQFLPGAPRVGAELVRKKENHKH